MTNKQFSMATFAKFANQDKAFQDAYARSFRKNVLNNGIIPREEAGILDNLTLDVTDVAEAIPNLVTGYMDAEKRSFDLPAPNDKTCPASLKIVHEDEKVKTGKIQFGKNAGQEYSTTVQEHDEFSVKNRRDGFKD